MRVLPLSVSFLPSTCALVCPLLTCQAAMATGSVAGNSPQKDPSYTFHICFPFYACHTTHVRLSFVCSVFFHSVFPFSFFLSFFFSFFLPFFLSLVLSLSLPCCTFLFFPKCVARVPVSLWGLRVCSLDVAFLSATVRNRLQPFPTVRVRTVWPCLW